MQKEFGNMKQIISPKLFSTLTFFLSITILSKLIWIAISLIFLPKSGEEFNEGSKAKALYYRVKLRNNASVIAPIATRKTPKRVQTSSMRGIKLLALYKSTDIVVVTVEKNRKTFVLGKGENIEGWVLEGAGQNYALFKKGGKEEKLALKSVKITNNQISTVSSRKQVSRTPQIKQSTKGIVEQDGIKMINRNLLIDYTKKPEKIWKDIGIGENKVNGKLNGFKINYVKRGSDFEKLGLKRGDLLMAINAEKLDNIAAVMSFYKDINNIENLTLTIERNGKSEDIEYEIQ